MSAPEHAKPIGKEQTEENVVSEKVKCLGCGWKGKLYDLLGVDPKENTTLWCPQCKCSSWEFV